MGLKTTNYEAKKFDIILSTAYARLTNVSVNIDGLASGVFEIHQEREDFKKLEDVCKNSGKKICIMLQNRTTLNKVIEKADVGVLCHDSGQQVGAASLTIGDTINLLYRDIVFVPMAIDMQVLLSTEGRCGTQRCDYR